MAWNNYTCKIANKPALVLIDDSFSHQAPILELSKVLWIAVFCLQPAGNGFWNPNETEELDKIEDNLIKFCQEYGYGWATYVLRVATSGVREYYIYHGEQAQMEKLVMSLRESHPTYRIESEIKEDKSWKQYRKFIK